MRPWALPAVHSLLCLLERLRIIFVFCNDILYLIKPLFTPVARRGCQTPSPQTTPDSTRIAVVAGRHGRRCRSSQYLCALLRILLLQGMLAPGLVTGACPGCPPSQPGQSTAWAKTGLSEEVINTTRPDSFPVTTIDRPYPTKQDVPIELSGLTIAVLGVAGVTFVGFMVCTAHILLTYLCCPPSSQPVSGCDAPAAAALNPEVVDGGAQHGQGGDISLTIVHPNNEVSIGTRLDTRVVGVHPNVLEGSRSGSSCYNSTSDGLGTVPLVHEDMPSSAALGEHPTLRGKDSRPTVCRGAGHSPYPCCS